MKKIIFSTLLVSLSFSVNLTTAVPAVELGADAVFVRNTTEKNHGHETFGSFITINPTVYAHTRIDQNIGFELGLEIQSPEHKTTALNGGIDTRYDQALVFNEKYTTRFHAYHPYVGITAEHPIVEDFKIFGMLGASMSIVNAKDQLIAREGFTLTDPQKAIFTHTFQAKKIIPMAKIGVKYRFTDHLGARVSANYRNLSQFDIRSNNTNNPVSLRLKDQFGVGAGLFFAF